jgi:Fe-S-cluster containining protein
MDDVPARPREPDEDEHPWLTILLDALHVLDHGLAHEVAAEEQRRGVRVGCHAGCTACCESSVPLRPIEVEGIAWYAGTRLDEDTWRRLEARLTRPEHGVCPFLLDGQCSVRPLRPIACRSFFVFGEPCRVGERLFELRPRDVFDRSEALYERMALRLLDDSSFGLRSDEDKRAAYHAGAMYRSALRMQQVDWVATIEAVRDARRPGDGSPDATDP